MYEELVGALRKRAMDLPEKFSRNAVNIDLLMKAADAIEEDDMAFRQLERDYKKLCAYLPKWIPVTERLPEKYDCYYLVVLNNWNTDFCLYTKEKGFGMYITPKWWDANDEVTHWMPLPEPPKEEQDDV